MCSAGASPEGTEPVGSRRVPPPDAPSAASRPAEAWPTAVPDTRFGDVRLLADVDSTNRLVLEAAAAGAPEGLVVAADHQRAGRGRLGRRWEAPAGANLLVSLLLRPGLAWSELHRCTVAVALAAADACRDVAGVRATCKWPNDLVLGDRKLAGILAETTGASPGDAPTRRPGPAAVVVGLGLNVGWAPPDSDGPSGLADPSPATAGLPVRATSLQREAGVTVDRGRLLATLLRHLEPRLAGLAIPEAAAAMAGEYRSRCSTLGRQVLVLLPDRRLEGRAVDVTDAGALVVDDGTRRHLVTAGDVVHVRPSA